MSAIVKTMRGLRSLLVAATFATLCSASQVPLALPNGSVASGRAITPEADAFARALLERHGVPGMSAGVVYLKDGGAVETEFGTWGIRTEDGDAVSPETLFYIGSCSKAFLSASIGILMDDFAHGRNKTSLPAGIRSLTWDTKIQDVLRDTGDWALMDQYASERANFRDVLGHVSGLPRHDYACNSSDTPADIVRRLRYLKPAHEFRQQYWYNNHMYLLGAFIVEQYSDMPFPTFVQERIIKPLNMTSTKYFVRDVNPETPISHAFTHDKRRIPLLFADPGAASLIAGAGGVISNTIDMTKWLAMLLNRGVNPHTGEVVVPKDVVDTVTTAYSIQNGIAPSTDYSVIGYGMGWARGSYKGHEFVSHSGGLSGFLTYTIFLPWDRFGVVVFINHGQVEDVIDVMAEHLIDNALGLQHSPQRIASSAEKPYPCAHSDTPPSEHLSHLPLADYEGTYTHPAFGSFILCSPSNTSPYCLDVLAIFATITPADAPASLYASWPRFRTRHLRLTPRSGGAHAFGLEPLTVYPHGFGKNTTAFIETSIVYRRAFDAVFDVEDGEVKGLAAPGGLESPPIEFDAELPLKEAAAIYFQKL